jgi:hypothetical protein
VPAGDGWNMPGWVAPVAITGGVLVIAGTLVEDVFTGGVGIADDAPAIGFGWGLIAAFF